VSKLPTPAASRAPGSILLWLHVSYFLVMAIIGYFAGDLMFGSASYQHGASVAIYWLSTSLVLLAAYLAMAARSGSVQQARNALLFAFIFDFLAPITLLRFPGMIHHFEVDLGMQPWIIPIAMIVLAGITAFELSRVWRIAKS
jgi:hypothetical protein